MLKAVLAVKAVQDYVAKWFEFIALSDTRVCEECMRFDLSVMTRKAIAGTFPYLEKASAEVWKPNVHPNCRCELRLIEEREVEEPPKKEEEPLFPYIELDPKVGAEDPNPEFHRELVRQRTERLFRELPSNHVADLEKVKIFNEHDIPLHSDAHGIYLVKSKMIGLDERALTKWDRARYVVYHETGHHVYYDDFTHHDDQEWDELWNKEQMPTPYSRTKPNEGFAECYAIYYEARSKMPTWSEKALSPKVQRFIEKVAKRGKS